MKTMLFFSVFTSLSVFASEVKVTSFRFLENGNHFSPAAEICGELLVPTGKTEMIKITSDPDSKSPANYFTWAGPEGKFCSLIATFTGKANVDIQK